MTDWESGSPTFSLIFLTWNSADVVERTFNSVQSQTYEDYEVLIVDNNSKDKTVPIVKEQYQNDGRFQVIKNNNNLGFTNGINKGIEAAQGKYICCYNDDTHFPRSYLKTLAESVTPECVYTTARINYRVSKEHETVRMLSDYGFPIPYIVDHFTGDAEVNYVPGDGVIVPRNIYESKLDNLIFDPELPDRGEDVDLSLRLSREGVTMKAIMDTYSIHPDEGFYQPTLKNAINHASNVHARMSAYRRNDFGMLMQLRLLLSLVVVPMDVFVRPFPRNGDFPNIQ